MPITVPVDTPDKPPSTPAEWYLDRVNALNDWYTWSRTGADNGYRDGVAGNPARSYGTGSAKNAGQGCGYAQGYALGQKMASDLGSFAPPEIELEGENGIFANCALGFDAWYEAHKHDKSAGSGSTSVSGAIVGWMKRTEVGGRVLVGRRVIFRLQPAGGVEHYSPGPAGAGAPAAAAQTGDYANGVRLGQSDGTTVQRTGRPQRMNGTGW